MPPTTQPHPRRLPLRRIRFFRFRDADLEADAFHRGPVDQSGGDGLSGALGHAAVPEDLVEGCGGGRGG